jgi:hypothetical protein
VRIPCRSRDESSNSTPFSATDKYEGARAFLAAKGVEVFEEEDRKKGVFVGRQFYIRDPDLVVGNTKPKKALFRSRRPLNPDPPEAA